MDKQFFVYGSIMALLAVMAGAFGAHALEDLLNHHGMYDAFQTGARYHMYHSLALLFTGFIAQKNPHQLVRITGILFLVGILLFSGSLYLMSITGQSWMGIITPFGGLSFMCGWAMLIYFFVRIY